MTVASGSALTLTLVVALTGCGGSVEAGPGAHRDAGSSLDATTGGAGDSGTPFSRNEGTADACVPHTCDQLDCGRNDDGCGGVVNCRACPADAATADDMDSATPSDGGSEDGTADSCVPLTCASLGLDCGAVGDGCGGVLQCGTCTAPQFCGGGGPYKCGGCGVPCQTTGDASPCIPRTCPQLGYTCGAAADGCGGVLNCGTCVAPDFCGAGGFSRCGADAGAGSDAAVDAQADAWTLSDAGGSAVIANSGSTNAVGFSITVTPDGHASWQNNPARVSSGVPNALGYRPTDGGTCASGTTVLSGALTAQLFNDLAAAGSLANLHFDNCAKSVSYGTTTSLTYDGATVPDTECGSSTDAHAAALSTDVGDVETAIAAACP